MSCKYSIMYSKYPYDGTKKEISTDSLIRFLWLAINIYFKYEIITIEIRTMDLFI